jgi:ribosomal protein S18 acetylase RimI-like enzyme
MVKPTDTHSDITFRPLRPTDIAEALVLWQATPGIGLSSADAPAELARFLERNPDLSFVAYAAGRLVGTVLCGHDGRRGYLYHLAVSEPYRHAGIGRQLATLALTALARAGIQKCHLFVYTDNTGARAFWSHTGWVERDELVIMSHDPPPETAAEISR